MLLISLLQMANPRCDSFKNNINQLDNDGEGR